MRVQSTGAHDIRQVSFENKAKFVRKIIDFYHKRNKKALTVLCSVIMHSGSGESTQEVGENTRVSPCTSFVLAPLPTCFITEESTVKAILFVKYRKSSNKCGTGRLFQIRWGELIQEGRLFEGGAYLRIYGKQWDKKRTEKPTFSEILQSVT